MNVSMGEEEEEEEEEGEGGGEESDRAASPRPNTTATSHYDFEDDPQDSACSYTSIEGDAVAQTCFMSDQKYNAIEKSFHQVSKSLLRNGC